MFEFLAYNKTCRIEAIDPFGSGAELILDARYHTGFDWAFIAAPSIYESQTKSKKETDARFKEVIQEINEALEETLGKDDTTAPESGFDRVQWLLKNKLSVVDNKLTIGEIK
jgi:hypothetical protein